MKYKYSLESNDARSQRMVKFQGTHSGGGGEGDPHEYFRRVANLIKSVLITDYQYPAAYLETDAMESEILAHASVLIFVKFDSNESMIAQEDVERYLADDLYPPYVPTRSAPDE